MNTCKECGSEVAEQDVFCPFCGLALAPAVTPEPEPASVAAPDDDPLESTIMMPAADAAAMAAAAAGTSVPEPEPEAGEADSTDAVEPEPPPPAILSGAPHTSDNVFAKKTSGSVQLEGGDAPKVEASTTVEHVEVESDAVEETVSEEIVDRVAEPAEPDMGSSFSEDATMIGIPLDQLQQASDDWEDDAAPVEAVSNSVPADQGSYVPDAPEAAVEDAAEPTPTAEEPEHEIDEEIRISKPLENLAEHDPFASNSMFDSVRIIDTDEPLRQDDVATRIKSLAPGRIEQSVEAAIDERSIEKGKVPDATSPNMGEGDTGNRRSAKLKPLPEGTILNARYEIVRKIGGGGMGAVYLASDNNLGGVLRAVKEMIQTHIEDDQQEKAINDFKRESMILSTLDHPSIPTIYDYFFDEEESRFYLVMKYISGGDLSSRLRASSEGKIEEKTVTEWAIQIVDVLDYLHNQPSTIVYRDLKPSNIMIDGNSGRVMLIDFGIARSISQREEKGVTAVGTMGYAPPELFSGNVEPRSDIYSLGSTMFHLLTGADPQSNPLLIFDFQKNPRPRQINPRLSDQIERILMRAVEYNADSRFTTAAEMRAALEDHLEGLRGGQVSFGVSAAPEAVSLANQNVFCGFCGQRIVATDLFCAFCGSKQPIAQHGVQSGVYTKAVPTAKLVIEGTSDLAPSGFSLQKDENLVGRRDPMSNIFPEVDLSKFDPQTKISRRHARIWRDGSNFLVEDLGSSNGTILDTNINNAIRLTPHQPHPLTSGDKIRIGDTTLQFVVS